MEEGEREEDRGTDVIRDLICGLEPAGINVHSDDTEYLANPPKTPSSRGHSQLARNSEIASIIRESQSSAANCAFVVLSRRWSSHYCGGSGMVVEERGRERKRVRQERNRERHGIDG